MADELKANGIFAAEQPRCKLHQLIVSAECAHFAGKLALGTQIGAVPGDCPLIENYALALTHDVHRQEDVVQNGACGNMSKHLAARRVESTGCPNDGAGRRLQFANLLFDAPVEAQPLPAL